MTKNKFNGDRLKSARTYRGLTISELAEQINLSKQAISLYENGKATPEPENLFKIINYLKFPGEYFFQSSLNVESSTTYFRALLSTNKKTRNQQVTKIEHLIKIYSVINKYIAFPKLNLPSEIYTENNDIEEITQKLRYHWNINDQPIKNIIHLLEKNGIVVSSFPTNSNKVDAFSQLIKINNDDKYVIVLSQDKHSAVRTQFDAAHELGHIILHSWSEDIETLPKEEFKLREKQANKFAASFLLPKNRFLKDLLYPTNLDYYVELKSKWNVSISAMIVRAHNIGVLSFNQYQYLMRQISKKEWKKKEPLDDIIPTQQPKLLNNAINLLLEKNVFNTETLIKELSDNQIAMNPNEIEFLLNLPKGKLSKINKENNILPLKIRPLKNK